MGHFHSLHAFLQMGGYAKFVWTAYAFVFVLFSIVAIKFHLQLRNLLAKDCKELPKEVVSSYAPET